MSDQPPPLDYDQVAALAYQIYEKAGCPQGCEHEHWAQAEQILRKQNPLRARPTKNKDKGK
ncbi:MAG: DUF2934 domain-containing protein [Chthoniobacterales bacterium]